jgi:outer membrane lipoprotein-sorting protein
MRCWMRMGQVCKIMRNALKIWFRVFLAVMMSLALAPPASARKGKHHADLTVTEVLSQMNEASKKLHTLSANLEYTKVTVLVDDKSTESGQLFYRRGKTPELRIEMQKPESKIIVFKKNRGEIFLPKINQIQEYDLQQKSDLLQQFFLLGFGTDTNELKKSYEVKYLREEDLVDDTTALLELTPRRANVSAQISKIQIWVSEESWLPTQQKFFEAGGDYLMAVYSGVKVNRLLPGSTFELNAPENAKRVKMN